MAAKLDDHDDGINEINITPFVDVVLVLLVIFMVTAPVMMKESLKVNLPKTLTSDVTAKTDSIGVAITKEGQVLFNGKPVIVEGGAIDSNGKGTLLTSEECLLHPDIQVRNPGFTKADYEAVFKEYLGITNVIWLGDGIEGDDTHGHIDDLCRFVNEDTIITIVESNLKDNNYKPLQDNLKIGRAHV